MNEAYKQPTAPDLAASAATTAAAIFPPKKMTKNPHKRRNIKKEDQTNKEGKGKEGKVEIGPLSVKSDRAVGQSMETSVDAEPTEGSCVLCG